MTMELDRNRLLTSQRVKDHKVASKNVAKKKEIIQNKVSGHNSDHKQPLIGDNR